MEPIHMKRIGVIKIDENGMRLELNKKFGPALEGLDGFSHLNVLWWFSKNDDDLSRDRLTEKSPYKNSPDILGTFATRSPMRPNPIGLSAVEITYIDYENAVIGIAYIDADNDTPVLDIKPYTPSIDRIKHVKTPNWCAHWPQSYEDSAAFDWENEFNF